MSRYNFQVISEKYADKLKNSRGYFYLPHFVDVYANANVYVIQILELKNRLYSSVKNILIHSKTCIFIYSLRL